jgi:multimeric flavodoxin WrbA
MIKLLDIVNEILDDEQSFNPKISSDKLEYQQKLDLLLSYLKNKKKILFLTCSNRTKGIPGVVDETPKSTALAYKLQELLENYTEVELIEIPELKILPCEGNVSRYDGNSCGPMKSQLKDKNKNPTGHHRCWASVNDLSDELWKVTKPMFESDAVIFFASVRWGQANMFYQKLIERLTWIENRHSTFNEENVIKNIDAGFICIGQNWNGETVVNTQKEVLKFYGFNVPDIMSFNWQYTDMSTDESQSSYEEARPAFLHVFNVDDTLLYKK